MKIGWIALGIALVALVLGLGCQAKDYKERIGPYEANFTLPDDTAANTILNKTTTSSETLDGIPYDGYGINLQTLETNRYRGSLVITHYNATYEMDLDVSAENSEGSCKGDGYNVVKSARRTIDGHEGYIVDCSGSAFYTEKYRFAYQLDNQSIVGGELYLDWDTAVVPFLKSLRVKEVPSS
jgi:hypothetical protein